VDTELHPAYQVGLNIVLYLWVSPETKFPILPWGLELGVELLVNEDECDSASQSSFPANG